jgi:hypothetical protein
VPPEIIRRLRPVKGRHKTTAMDRILRWQSGITAEQIARAIEANAAGPGQLCTDPYCPDYQRHEQARQDAATARRIGGARAQPACPDMAAGRR